MLLYSTTIFQEKMVKMLLLSLSHIYKMLTALIKFKIFLFVAFEKGSCLSASKLINFFVAHFLFKVAFKVVTSFF